MLVGLSHHEKYKITKRKWAEAHPERVREINRAYYARHHERKAAEMRAKRKANPEKAKAIKKRWMVKHPNLVKASQITRKIKRRARERSAEGHFHPIHIKLQLRKQYGLCAYCGIYIVDTYEVDHIVPLAKGGTNWADNLVLACRTCNRKKGTQTWSSPWLYLV